MEVGWKLRSPSVERREIPEDALDERCRVGLPSVLLRLTKYSFLSSPLSFDLPRNPPNIVRYDCRAICEFYSCQQF